MQVSASTGNRKTTSDNRSLFFKNDVMNHKRYPSENEHQLFPSIQSLCHQYNHGFLIISHHAFKNTMVRIASTFSCSILAGLLFVRNFEGSNGFVGNGLQTKFQQKFASPRPFATSYPSPKFDKTSDSKISPRDNQTSLRLANLDGVPLAVAKSLFRYSGTVPIAQAFALNVFLFVGVRKKLLKMLTTEGYFHALALAVGLWSSLGWRGWTTCVLYLFLGSAVTKVKFQEKEKAGIAEGRGGRRGPENVW